MILLFQNLSCAGPAMFDGEAGDAKQKAQERAKAVFRELDKQHAGLLSAEEVQKALSGSCENVLKSRLTHASLCSRLVEPNVCIGACLSILLSFRFFVVCLCFNAVSSFLRSVISGWKTRHISTKASSSGRSCRNKSSSRKRALSFHLFLSLSMRFCGYVSQRCRADETERGCADCV